MTTHHDLIATHIQESLDNALDMTIAEMQKDGYYAEQKKTIEKSFAENRIDDLLTAQMTVHNMELEAVYRAGHRDCIAYLSEIGALKNE